MNEAELQAKIELLIRQNEHLKDDIRAIYGALQDAIYELEKIKLWYLKVINKYINGGANE